MPTLEEVDLDVFKELIEHFDDEFACNIPHDAIANLNVTYDGKELEVPGKTCSGEVVAIGSACQVTLRLCKNALDFVAFYVGVGLSCPWCDRPAIQCWRVNAV